MNKNVLICKRTKFKSPKGIFIQKKNSNFFSFSFLFYTFSRNFLSPSPISKQANTLDLSLLSFEILRFNFLSLFITFIETKIEKKKQRNIRPFLYKFPYSSFWEAVHLFFFQWFFHFSVFDSIGFF